MRPAKSLPELENVYSNSAKARWQIADATYSGRLASRLGAHATRWLKGLRRIICKHVFDMVGSAWPLSHTSARLERRVATICFLGSVDRRSTIRLEGIR